MANTTPAFVTGLLGPLLTTDHIALVKGFYTRPLHGDPTGGGRVTELVARPVLELLFPELSWVRQPLAGETAAHRWVFEKLGFAGGYGVELGLLIDVAQQLGRRPPGPGRPGRAHPPQPAPARAAAPGRRRAAGRARARRPRRAAAAGRERRRERHHRRLQPRPADLPRRAPTARSSRCPAGGGLASSLHRLLAGSGTTWASVTMGAADREAVAQGLMHEDGLDLVPVVVDDDTYRQAYDVVANTTLWYCHHHLFDLPHRPRFDRHWRTAWEGYRAYNRAMADVGGGAGRRGRRRAACRTTTSRCSGGCWPRRRPDLRTVHFLHTPFAAPDMLGVLPDDVVAELLDGMAGYGACGFHCHQWEAGFAACYAAAGRPAPPTFVAPLGPDAGVLEDEAASPALRRGGGRAAGRGGRAPHHRPGRPHGAVEEHRAGDARLRGAAARPPRVARPRWCTWRLAYP